MQFSKLKEQFYTNEEYLGAFSKNGANKKSSQTTFPRLARNRPKYGMQYKVIAQNVAQTLKTTSNNTSFDIWLKLY
jgi:hypothetical protein